MKKSTKLKSNSLYLVLPICYFALVTIILLSLENKWINPKNWDFLFWGLYLKLIIMFIALGFIHAISLAK